MVSFNQNNQIYSLVSFYVISREMRRIREFVFDLKVPLRIETIQFFLFLSGTKQTLLQSFYESYLLL